MPRQTGIHECGNAMRGLPRRHSQAPVRRQLRTMPHGQGLAGFRSSKSTSTRTAFLCSELTPRWTAARATRGPPPDSSWAYRRSATRATRRSIKPPRSRVMWPPVFPPPANSATAMNTWLGAQFDHLKFTGFALTGAHVRLDCTACHVGGKFAGTPATCVGCHLPDFQKTTNPNHVQAGFPQTCQSCHTTAAWQPATFDHNTFTKFPLTGAPRDRRLQPVPRERTVRRHSDGLRLVPHEGLSRHDQSESRAGRDSRPPALLATTQPRGPMPHSTTARPGSR